MGRLAGKPDCSDNELKENAPRECAAPCYSSSPSFVSSILISLNSLDSNMSPHSLHSTYSESSSRETICTSGCLQSSRLIFCCESCCLEDCEGWLGIIGLKKCVAMEEGVSRCSRNFPVFCDGPVFMSSPQKSVSATPRNLRASPFALSFSWMKSW